MSTISAIRPAAYQLIALTKVMENGLNGALVADGVGVGKTISAAYVALYTKESARRPALVVCPPSLIPKWIEELRTKFAAKAFPVRSEEDLATARAESRHPRATIPIYVMTNSLLTKVGKHEFPRLSCIIFDEIHTYRNRETNSFRACLELSLLAHFRIGLSATPINNSLDDLVSEMNIVFPDFKWSSLQAVVEEVWRFDRSKLTTPFITRFTKDKLGLQFAQRVVKTGATQYDSDYVRRVKEVVSRVHPGRGSFYEMVTYYRMAASSPYAFFRAFRMKDWEQFRDPKLEGLKQILASGELEQWLVFCEFEDTVSYLEQNITDWTCFTMTGSTPMDERPAIIRAFEKTPNSVLIMTSVGSEGLDLQFCNGIINYDIHWNPMRLEQRIGRVDRVGQRKSNVIVHNIVVHNSVDERVVRVILKKLTMIRDSVFATGQILGTIPPSGRGEGMYDQPSLALEMAESDRLLRSLRYSEEVKTEDYAILPNVDPGFCIPSNLAKAASEDYGRTIWLKPTSQSLEWLDKVKTQSAEIQKLVRYYS